MLPSVFVFAAFLRTGAGLIRLVPLGECEQRVRCLIKVDGPRATDDKVAQSNNDNENESYTGTKNKVKAATVALIRQATSQDQSCCHLRASR